MMDYYDTDPEFQSELLKEEREFKKHLKKNYTDVSGLNIEDRSQNKPEVSEQ